MLKKLTALAMAVIMMLMCAAVQADAATNTPLETALNTFTEKYADNDSSKIEIQNVYMLTAQDGAALNDDARRLFTDSQTKDDSYDALIYIIARQYAYDFPIPYIMTAGDARTGQSLVVRAIADGLKAADACGEYLK